jgi:hypothetical protein
VPIAKGGTRAPDSGPPGRRASRTCTQNCSNLAPANTGDSASATPYDASVGPNCTTPMRSIAGTSTDLPGHGRPGEIEQRDGELQTDAPGTSSPSRVPNPGATVERIASTSLCHAGPAAFALDRQLALPRRPGSMPATKAPFASVSGPRPAPPPPPTLARACPSWSLPHAGEPQALVREWEAPSSKHAARELDPPQVPRAENVNLTALAGPGGTSSPRRGFSCVRGFPSRLYQYLMKRGTTPSATPENTRTRPSRVSDLPVGAVPALRLAAPRTGTERQRATAPPGGRVRPGGELRHRLAPLTARSTSSGPYPGRPASPPVASVNDERAERLVDVATSRSTICARPGGIMGERIALYPDAAIKRLDLPSGRRSPRRSMRTLWIEVAEACAPTSFRAAGTDVVAWGSSSCTRSKHGAGHTPRRVLVVDHSRADAR